MNAQEGIAAGERFGGFRRRNERYHGCKAVELHFPFVTKKQKNMVVTISFNFKLLNFF
jgi:hypothetical protein